MIFVFKREALLFKYLVMPDDGEYHSYYANDGDICFVLTLNTETVRSLILHPEHGLVWSYVKPERGTLYNIDGSK
jgi:hypothetical protein